MKKERRRLPSSPILLLLLPLLVLSCHPPAPPTAAATPSGPLYFQEVTEESGLTFIHEVGSMPLDQYFMPHIMGSGVAIFDFDNDGRPDIYLIQNGGPRSQATNR